MKKDKMAVIQVIERAFNILTLLSEHPNGVRVTTISQSLQLPKSTTSRILSNLARFEAVCQTEDHRWLIGPGLLRLTNQQSFVQTLTALAHPCLQRFVKLKKLIKINDSEQDLEFASERGDYAISSRTFSSFYADVGRRGSFGFPGT